MPAFTIYTRYRRQESFPLELETGRTYHATIQDHYGIIVIEDALRVSSGNTTIGTFKDDRLILIDSPGGLDIEFGIKSRRMNLNAAALYLQVEIIDELPVVTVIKPDYSS